jgi:hypothetical protein
MKVNHFSSEHRVRLRDFFRQTQDYTRQHASDKLMLQMSAQLRGDTALSIGTSTLDKIWYFKVGSVLEDARRGEANPAVLRECEPQFLSLVALNLQPCLYEAREVVPTTDLTVIDSGVVARRLVMLTKGAVLGTDCVIPDKLAHRRPLEAAYSLTFCQVLRAARGAYRAVPTARCLARGAYRACLPRVPSPSPTAYAC